MPGPGSMPGSFALIEHQREEVSERELVLSVEQVR